VLLCTVRSKIVEYKRLQSEIFTLTFPFYKLAFNVCVLLLVIIVCVLLLVDVFI